MTGPLRAAAPSYFDLIGYAKLANQLGAFVPTGAGIRLTQVEGHEDSSAADGKWSYKPDPTYWDFGGKAFNVIYPPGMSNADVSVHATNVVGAYYYGNSQSMVPGATHVNVMMAGDWQADNYLRVGSTYNPRWYPTGATVGDRVASHAYVGAFGGSWDLESLERTDWVIDRDHYIQVVGSVNGRTALPLPEMAASFNAIRLGRLDGEQPIGTSNVGGLYIGGRQGIDLVAPASSTSSATAIGSGAAALLVDAGHSRPSLSAGFENTRDGRTIYHAETSQVIKAALMAGATRSSVTASTNAYGDSYNRNSTNGLDARYGAGQINIFNSWHILDRGEQNAAGGGGPATILHEGWDYAAGFGGAGATAIYHFTRTNSATDFSATLAWNAAIDMTKVVAGSNQNLNAAAAVYDLNLALYQVTTGGDVLIQSSSSLNLNTENLYLPTLGAGAYKLIVSSSGSFSARYGLAWRMTLGADFNNDGLVNASDIDRLFSNRGGDADLYDLNEDGSVTNADVDYMLNSILHRRYGDANLDGAVDTADLQVVRTNLGRSGVGWLAGNFNGDLSVDTSDLALLRSNLGLAAPGLTDDPFLTPGLFSGDGGSSLGFSSVPEPSSVALLALLAALPIRRR